MSATPITPEAQPRSLLLRTHEQLPELRHDFDAVWVRRDLVPAVYGVRALPRGAEPQPRP